MAYLDGNGLQYFAQKLATKFVKKTQTVNGKALSGNIVLKASDFAQSVTNEKGLAGLVYTEPRTDTISVTGKSIAAENITFSYGSALSDVLTKGQITSNPTNPDLIAKNDGTYKVSVPDTTRFPIKNGTLFVSTAGATYKMFLMVGTTGGLWYRVAAYNDGTWYDDWKHAIAADSELDGRKVMMPYGKNLDEVLHKGQITSNPASDADVIAIDDGTYKISVGNTTVFPIQYGSLFISTCGATYKMFVLVGTTGGLWYRCANYANGTWYDDWAKTAKSSDIPVTHYTSYTPNFTWSGESSGPTVNLHSSYYVTYGSVVQIAMRFTITALNAPSSAKTLVISLPEGLNVIAVGAVLGELYHGGSTNDTNFLINCNGPTSLKVFTGTGLGTISDRLTAGTTYAFSVILFKSN